MICNFPLNGVYEDIIVTLDLFLGFEMQPLMFYKSNKATKAYFVFLLMKMAVSTEI